MVKVKVKVVRKCQSVPSEKKFGVVRHRHRGIGFDQTPTLTFIQHATGIQTTSLLAEFQIVIR